MLTLLRTPFLIILALFATVGCRTAADEEGVARTPPPLTLQTTSTELILRKSTGALTTKYPENRLEECFIGRSDITNQDEVDSAIANISNQALAESFIFRAQVPSIQYFTYWKGEPLLLSEMGDEEMMYRQPEGEIGNHSLDILMNIFEEKCGPNNTQP